MAAATGTVTTYTVTGTIKHDGQFYYQDEALELSDKQAEGLLRVGAIAVKANPADVEGAESSEGADGAADGTDSLENAEDVANKPRSRAKK